MINTEAWPERSGSESVVLHRGTELLRGLELSPGMRAHVSFFSKNNTCPCIFFAVNRSASGFSQGK